MTSPDSHAIRATAVAPRGAWQGDAADSVVLDFDDRHRRRIAMTGVRGTAFLLDLPEAVALRGGDALVLEDGRLIEVVAAPEPLVEIRAASPAALVRLAWHVGNRHLPAQVTERALRIRRDHVIEDMLRGLGARLVEIDAAFDPEGGAYAGGTAAPPSDHGHGGHGHGHHGHDHGEHDHSPREDALGHDHRHHHPHGHHGE